MYIYSRPENFFGRFLYHPERYMGYNEYRLALLLECFFESWLQHQYKYSDEYAVEYLLERITMGDGGNHSFDEDEEIDTFSLEYVTDFFCYALKMIIVHDEDKGNKVRELVFAYFKALHKEEFKYD